MAERENNKRAIFRAEAVQRYLQSQQESVIPKFLSSYAFPYMWILIGLLIVSLCLTWLVHIPVYASGQAVVVEEADSPLSNSLTLVIFLPPRYQNELREGQTVFIQSESNGEPFQQKIIAISPTVVSPEAASAVYGAASGIVIEPTAVALAHFEPAEISTLSASTYVGSRYSVQVEVGSRRLISLLPSVINSS